MARARVGGAVAVAAAVALAVAAGLPVAAIAGVGGNLGRAAATAPHARGLTQAPGPAGCVGVRPDPGCTLAAPVAAAVGASIDALAVSRSGRNLYVGTSRDVGDGYGTRETGVMVFARDRRTGALAQRPGADGYLPIGPGAVRSLAVSGDGRDVYVVVAHAAGEDSAPLLLDLRRDPGTGRLRRDAGVGRCVTGTRGVAKCSFLEALSAAGYDGDRGADVVIAPDDSTLYVPVGDSRIAVLRRSPSAGRVAPLRGARGCVPFNTHDPLRRRCTLMRPLADVPLVTLLELTPTADGRTVYAVRRDADYTEVDGDLVDSYERETVAVFRRDAAGALTQLPGRAGCVVGARADELFGEARTCAADRWLSGITSVSVTPDARHV